MANSNKSTRSANSPITRWLRFNLIGALGLTVQLASLALLHHAFPTHALITSAAAVELTLLHNLTWHWHYTWRDRRHTTTPCAPSPASTSPTAPSRCSATSSSSASSCISSTSR